MRVSSKSSIFGRHRTAVFRAFLIGLCFSSVTMAQAEAEYRVTTDVKLFTPPIGWVITGTTATDTAYASVHYFNNLATAGAYFARPQPVPPVPPGGPASVATAQVLVTVTWEHIGIYPPSGFYYSHTHVNATVFSGTSSGDGPNALTGLGLALEPQVQMLTTGHTGYWSQDADCPEDLKKELGMQGEGTILVRATVQVGLDPLKMSGYGEGRWWMTTGAVAAPAN